MTAVKSSDCTLQQIRNLACSDLNFVTFENAPLILKLEYLSFESKLRGRFIHFSNQNLIYWMILPCRKMIEAPLAHRSLKTKCKQYFGTSCIYIPVRIRISKQIICTSNIRYNWSTMSVLTINLTSQNPVFISVTLTLVPKLSSNA